MAPLDFKFWLKATGIVGGIGFGGPWLVWKITPTEDEIVQKYNPELRARALKNREKTKDEFDEYLTKLRVYSQSDKPIWLAEKDKDMKKKAEEAWIERKRQTEEAKANAAAMKAEMSQ